MNKTKLFKVLLLSVVLIIGLSQLVYAAALPSPPWSECYWYSDPGAASVFNINHNLHYIGYDARVYGNTHAYYVRRTMYKDAVFYIHTHGYAEGGRVKCANDTKISALMVLGDDSNYSLQARYGDTTDKLKWTKLTYWAACHTAESSSKYGDLDNYCYWILGVDSTVAFNGIRDVINGPYFDDRFFVYAALSGYNVRDALNRAKNDAVNKYGYAPNYVCMGGGVKIKPPSYGNY